MFCCSHCRKECITKGTLMSHEKNCKVILLEYNNEIKKFIHSKTGMAFKKNKIVCGKLCKENNGEEYLAELTPNDQEICRNYGFKFED
jgi:hypothetical protein